MLTPEQIRVVRAIRRWSAHQRAEKAGVHSTAMPRMESGNGSVGGAVQTRAKVPNAQEDAGVEFTAQKGLAKLT